MTVTVSAYFIVWLMVTMGLYGAAMAVTVFDRSFDTTGRLVFGLVATVLAFLWPLWCLPLVLCAVVKGIRK